MAFDYKKEYRALYAPTGDPTILTVPKMQFMAVRGVGDPNAENGDYSAAVGLLYALSYTLKMSHKGTRAIEGFFEYVVPPLEGFWWQEGLQGVDYSNKAGFQWISLIRMPDFVQPDDFAWAKAEATLKKKMDFTSVEWLAYDEGLCVQCLHIGSYDDEPKTVQRMDAFAAEQGYRLDISSSRHHHEIYISDPRKTAPEKCKTIIRHPICLGR